MNFLWDIALRAQGQGRREEELFFRQAKDYSPFYEQAFSCLNETGVRTETVELNLLYRFADIFQYLLAEEPGEYPQFTEYLIDAALHVILHTDLVHGVTRREILMQKLMEELENGTFWREAAETYRAVPPEKRSRIAALVLSQMQTGASVMLFRRALVVLFPEAVLYRLRAEPEKLILYLKESRSGRAQQQLTFLEDFFLPLHCHLRVFWKYHFGIIGVDDAMRMDEIAIY